MYVRVCDNECKNQQESCKFYIILPLSIIRRLDFGALLKSIIGSFKSIIGSSLLQRH